MLIRAFQPEELRERLTKLSNKKQIAFGAICCERLLPNYHAFQKDAGWGDWIPIRKALDCAWSSVIKDFESLEEIETLKVSCDFLVPDSEDFESIYVSMAQDACFAICSLLDYMIDNDVDKIVQIGAYATDSVDLYVQEVEQMDPIDPELEQNIHSHRFMQRELSQQEANLSLLENTHEITLEFLGVLHNSWGAPGKSNLDLC